MRNLVRKFLNKYGYDIIKTTKWAENKINKKVNVTVGNFDILMPGNNPQIINYKNIPDLNIDLAKLAKAVGEKYSDYTLIDVGANVGDTIAVVKSIIEIPIIAIEGDVTSYEFLELNTKQFKNVKTINCFLGEFKEEKKVDIDKKGWNNTLVPNKNANTTIKLNRLDDVLKEKSLANENYKLLKIDTEGFDTIILRGCSNLLSQNKPIVFFEYNAQNMKVIGENGFLTLLSFKDFGYNNVLIFDGLSNLIVNTTLHNVDLLSQLNDYIHKEKAVIAFFDICVFHKDDEDIMCNFLTK